MTRQLRRRDEALLVALADGARTGAARGRAEARLRALPDGERLIQRQRRVARALGAGAERPAPQAAGSSRPALRLVAAAAMAGVLAVLLALMPQGGGPSAERVADVAQLASTAPAPDSTGRTLRAEVGGVTFPDWGPEFGWHATGMRRDEIDGRSTTTVFYEHTTHRLAYTIVDGAALPRPSGAQIVERDGLQIALYRDPRHGGHDVAVFERGGRTCVVAGHVMKLSTLLKLSAWKVSA
jgi:hypothetical protein